MPDTTTLEIVQRHATQLNLETAAPPLLDAIDPRVSLVLIGEATHVTHELYRLRADLTRALVQHRGFPCVAAEADWPDAVSCESVGPPAGRRPDRRAMGRMRAQVSLAIMPGATHLFEEPGTLEHLSRLAVAWCRRHLGRTRS
jgi:hypothetical protein